MTSIPSPSTPICVRFAPSPTGHLHIGGVRTALFSYLYAKQQSGKFVLRIEDTDRQRSLPEYEQEILSSMKWLGLKWDGELVRQSQRIERYQEVAQILLDQDLAYESIEDGKKAIRFRMPQKIVKFRDIVHGEVSMDSSEWDDLVIIKSDGFPTYHFAVVVDDHDMEISHVIRGDDHLTNTPKHILLYLALNWKVPKYAHLPLIMGADGTPLSKRHGAVATSDYEDQGFLPDAMLNYLALLGWGPENNEEIFSLEQLIKKFSLKRITKSNSRFNPEKLLWLNGQHLKKMSEAEYVYQMTEYWADKNEWVKHSQWTNIIKLYKTRARTFKDLAFQASYIFSDALEYDSAVLKQVLPLEMTPLLQKWIQRAESMSFDNPHNLEQMTRDIAQENDVKAGVLIHPLRFAISGTKVTPGLFELMQVLEKEKCLNRVQSLIEKVTQNS